MLEMSKLVTCESELRDLGAKVLKLRRCEIQSALYNHRQSIQDAAYDVLSKWRDQFLTPQKAYNSLYTGLRTYEKNQWADQLQKLAGDSEVTTQEQLCPEKG